MADAKRVILVHSPDHVKAACEAALSLQCPLALQSAPDAIFYAGSAYLLQLFNDAKAACPTLDLLCILDCADAQGEAVEALRIGHKHIRSSGPEALRSKLAGIARQCGGELLDNAYESIDLHQFRNSGAACLEFLSKD